MDVALEAKLAFLLRADNYPDRPSQVQAIETHLAWIFLTDRFAYKLKKPARYPYLDFSTLASREFYCREEVRLNRRLAKDVYLGVVPLTRRANGSLALDGRGEIVDWLVWMRRLPQEWMLDRLLADRRVETSHFKKLALRLTDFYRNCPLQEISGREYHRRYLEAVQLNWREFLRLRFALPEVDGQALCAAQLEFLERRADWFAARSAEGRIVEGHGDLRPQHICFEAPWPKIIDCLEFNRELRLVDSADEAAYLALECQYLGHAEAGRNFLRIFTYLAKDTLPPGLEAFYLAYRATLRGRLLLARVHESPAFSPRFIRRATRYLKLANFYALKMQEL
jgi:aminoglycoside phosphotransferase family enzyme